MTNPRSMIPLAVRNPGFDLPYNQQAHIPQLKVAHEWDVHWVEGPDSGSGFLVRPECYPKYGTGGDYYQGLQTTSATHVAAFVQSIALPPLAVNIIAEARVSYYAPKGGMAVRVGLDGTGQVNDLDASTIHWGSWLNQDGDPPWKAETFTIAKATLPIAETGYMSVWLESMNRWRGRDNHVFWEEVFVYMQGEDTDPDPDPTGAAELIMQAVELLLDAVGKL